MQKLAEVCVKRPVFAAVLILILVVVGVFGFTKLGVDRFPKVENPTVTVSTSYPGASPEAVETEITEIIEGSVNTVSGINELTSTSSEGSSSVRISFNLDKDPDVATQEVRDKVGLVQRRLPDSVDPPTIRKQDPDSMPIIGVAVSGTGTMRSVTEYADKVLRPQFENSDGVGEVLLNGGRLRQINIIPDPFKMRGYGVTVNDLITTLQEGNVEVPGGEVENGANSLTLRTQGRVRKVEDFGKLALRAGNGGILRVSDIAKVEDGEATASNAAEIDGKPTVLLYIRKQSGVNTLAVIDGVKERVERARDSLPPGYQLSIVRDQSQFIEAAVHAVEEHLIVGSILATLVVLIFLLNWRATLISAISIPASIIATFGLMWAFGYTLNIITLLALTLAVGIVIDDAIVVIENIYRVMEEKGYTAFEAAIEGTREIGLAVLATTLSLVAVFLPVAFMEGLTGRFLASFGVTMSFAILVSLVVSFTLAPSLGARWLSHGSPAHATPKSELNGHAGGHGSSSKDTGFFSFIDRTYTALLEWSMGHRWVIVLICIGSLAAVPTLYNMAPFNFLPQDDESQFQVTARAPQGTSLEEMTKISREIAQEIKKVPGVEYSLMTINGWGPVKSYNNADFYVRLKPIGERKQDQSEVISTIRRSLGRKFRSQGLIISARPMNPLPGIGISSGGQSVQYVISGPDLDLLAETSEKMVEQMKTIPGVADADSDYVAGTPEFVAKVDRDLAATLGVNVNNVAQALNYVVGGEQVTTFDQGGYQYEVHIRGPLDYRKDRQGISLWTVSSTQGAINLDQVTTFSRSTGPVSIKRLNRQRQIVLTATQTPDASAGEILNGIDRIFKSMDLPPGYAGQATGSSREQLRALNAFKIALILSVTFMFLILAAQFESWIHPITILLSLPLTVPFALLSVIIFGQSLNIYSALGMLLLFGVVKKNAILQVDHTNQLREKGMNRHDAIVQANRDRLRPILMTTIAFVAGMIPLVVSSGVGSGTNRAIGTVIFGGQTFSLLLTLLATPVAYSLLDDLIQITARVRYKITGKKPQPPQSPSAPSPFKEEAVTGRS